jgi:hypothetical protein
MHLGYHVGSVEQDGLALGSPQRHVNYGSLLGGIDSLATEHGIDALMQTGSFGEGDEQPDGL